MVRLGAWIVLACLWCGSAGADEAALRKAIAAYTEAFNRGDVEAMLSAWTDDAVWTSATGERTVGKDAIRAQLSGGLAGKGVLEIVQSDLRFVTPNVAVEEGTARLSLEGEFLGEEHYEAMHVETPQGWKMTSLREFPAQTTAVNPNLEPLSWLVGEWIDQSEEATVSSSVSWSRNHAFLINSFSVEMNNEDALDGMQVIGWDPAAQVIRSWIFDSDGAFGQGTWQQDGDQWVVRSTMTLADGRQASSSNFYRPQSPDRYLWRSIGRKVGNEFLPNIDNVQVVRKGLEVVEATPEQAGQASSEAAAEPAKSETIKTPEQK